MTQQTVFDGLLYCSSMSESGESDVHDENFNMHFTYLAKRIAFLDRYMGKKFMIGKCSQQQDCNDSVIYFNIVRYDTRVLWRCSCVKSSDQIFLEYEPTVLDVLPKCITMK